MIATMTTTMYSAHAFDNCSEVSFDWQDEDYFHVPVEDWAAEMEQAELEGKTFYNDETGDYEVIDDPKKDDEEEKEHGAPPQVPFVAAEQPKVSVWTRLSTDGATTASITIGAEFPPLGTPPLKTKKTVLRRQKMIPFKIEIKIRRGPSALVLKHQEEEQKKKKKEILCKFAVEGKRCPHKVCRFVHPPPRRQLCKFVLQGIRCPHKVCRFFHPPQQHPQQQQRQQRQ